jgi:uncharacterized Zn finger protein
MKVVEYCDVCKDETEHELIRKEKNLYRCRVCGSVRQIIPEREIEVKAIISTSGESEVGRIRVKESEMLKVGDEIVVETEDEIKVGEVTALELKDGRRVEIAEAREVQTVWLRNVSEVDVKFSLHKGAVTTPYKMRTTGETEFEIGERINIDNYIFRITRIKKLDGKLLKKRGEKAKAKEIKRVYAMFERKL